MTNTLPLFNGEGAIDGHTGTRLDRHCASICAAHTALEVETELNVAKIGCARVFNTRDRNQDAHYAARKMTMRVLDRQSGVPIRVYGAVPKMSLTSAASGAARRQSATTL